MPHSLDRPIWSALTGPHAQLAVGDDLARRYGPGMVAFAATPGDAPENLAALEALLNGDETLIMLQANPVALPPGLVATTKALGVQMIASQPHASVTDDRITPLGEADAADMLELANLTKPGPFTLKALKLGRFWGVRRDGRLIAMAGERMRQTDWTELSGVCTHPDSRGEGLGRLMSAYVAGQIAATGSQAYLHAFANNHAAIELYRSLGFELRSDMHVAMVRKA